MRLWIIGNGFDLYHGLKSSYPDYKAYLCQHNTCRSKNCEIPVDKLPREVCEFCCKTVAECGGCQNKECPVRKFNDLPRAGGSIVEELWKDLENACSIDLDALLQLYLKGWSGREPDSSSGETPLSHLLQEKLDFAYLFTGADFYDWLSELDKELDGISVHPLEQKLDISPSDWFITFNYTRTLQKLYQINGDIDQGRIYYVHGRLDQVDEKLGRTPPEDKATSTTPIVRSHIVFGSPALTDDVIYNAIEKFAKSERAFLPENEKELRECLRKLLKYLKKDVSRGLEGMKEFVHSRKLHGSLEEVVVAGHSLGEIDQPYFDYLADFFKDVRWRFLFHSENDRNTAWSFLETHRLNGTCVPWNMSEKSYLGGVPFQKVCPGFTVDWSNR